MPWKGYDLMDQKMKFVARLLEGEKMAPLCREFGISRKTGYKLFERYREGGRICRKGMKIHLTTALADQKIGLKEVYDRIWLVSFMEYDLGYFDEDECKLQPLDNPFGSTVLPMSPVRTLRVFSDEIYKWL